VNRFTNSRPPIAANIWQSCRQEHSGSFSEHNVSIQIEPGSERVQALADISGLALCCDRNEIRAPTADLPNSAQHRGHPYHSPCYMRVRAVVWECGDGQTDRDTHRQTAVTSIHFASATPHAKCCNFVDKPTIHGHMVCNSSPCVHLQLYGFTTCVECVC